MAHRTIRAKRRRARRACYDALAWMAVGLLLAIGASSFLGGPVRLVVVRGTSMTPTYASGDLVIVQSITTASQGDVVAYEIPGQPGARVIHRVVGGDEQGFTTRGDHRRTDDPWRPSDSDLDGSVVLHLPRVGRLFGSWLLPLVFGALSGIALTCALWSEPEPRPSRRVA